MDKKRMSDNPADLSKLNYVIAPPKVRAQLKTLAEDFIVEEISDKAFSGHGEHLWCWVEKKNQNTDWVAGQLAKWANTSRRNVGFAGQKDRHAITRQWFSIHLPGKADPDVQALQVEGVRLLEMQRHNKKCQRGDLLGNRFAIVLRKLQWSDNNIGTNELIMNDLESRLQKIQQQGFANYFGSQRFGWQGQNLIAAEKLFALADDQQQIKKRKRRQKGSQKNKDGLYLSAVRSWMFNELLSHRIALNCWTVPVSGDIIEETESDGQSSIKPLDDSDLLSKQVIVNNGALDEDGLAEATMNNLVGTLFGDADLLTSEVARDLELQVQACYPNWILGLKSMRVQPAYRAFQVLPRALSWEWISKDSKTESDELANSLKISFILPAGSFATALLREVAELYEVREANSVN